MIANKAKARREIRIEDPVVKECPGRLIRLVLAKAVLLRFSCKS